MQTQMHIPGTAPRPCPAQPESGQAPREVHIAGVLVQARAQALPQLQLQVGALPGASLEQVAPDGRMVVLVEAGSAAQVMDTLAALRELRGVLNVALVYQHAEPWDEMQQEMP